MGGEKPHQSFIDYIQIFPSLSLVAAEGYSDNNAVLMMMMMRKKFNSHFSLSLSLSSSQEEKRKKSIFEKTYTSCFLTNDGSERKKISHLHHNVVQIDSQTGTYSSSKFSNFLIIIIIMICSSIMWFHEYPFIRLTSAREKKRRSLPSRRIRRMSFFTSHSKVKVNFFYSSS